MVKERFFGRLVLCEATEPTDCPELHPTYEVQEANGQSGYIRFYDLPCKKGLLLSYTGNLYPSLLKSRVSVITVT